MYREVASQKPDKTTSTSKVLEFNNLCSFPCFVFPETPIGDKSLPIPELQYLPVNQLCVCSEVNAKSSV